MGRCGCHRRSQCAVFVCLADWVRIHPARLSHRRGADDRLDADLAKLDVSPCDARRYRTESVQPAAGGHGRLAAVAGAFGKDSRTFSAAPTAVAVSRANRSGGGGWVPPLSLNTLALSLRR